MGEASSEPGLELRAVGLRVAANLLSMPIAEVDGLRAASNAADLEACPVCGPHPRRAS